MKTFRLVMMLFLLPLLSTAADSGVDQEVTVVGKDETLLAVPDPWMPDLVDTPLPDTIPMEAPSDPLILPPQSEPPAEGGAQTAVYDQ